VSELARRRFDVAKDPAEQHDLASEMPEKAKQLDQKLTEYLIAPLRNQAVAPSIFVGVNVIAVLLSGLS
jgi:hypothetical protein